MNSCKYLPGMKRDHWGFVRLDAAISNSAFVITREHVAKPRIPASYEKVMKLKKSKPAEYMNQVILQSHQTKPLIWVVREFLSLPLEFEITKKACDR